MVEKIKQVDTKEKAFDVGFYEKMVGYMDSLINLKFVSEEAGKNLMSEIESHKIGLEEIRLEVKNLLKNRVDALEIIKDDPSLKDSQKEEILVLYEKLTASMKELDLLK